MAKKKTLLSKRAKDRLARMRREPAGRLALEINRYLETIGWRSVVMGKMQIRGFETPGFGQYEFAVGFSGGRIKPSQKSDADASKSSTR